MPTLPDPLVSSRPEWMSGALCFHGTRVPVKTMFDYLAAGHSLDEFLIDFPDVTYDHAVAALVLAGQKLKSVLQAA